MNSAPAATRARTFAVVIRVRDVVDLALDCFFPRACVGCGRIGSYMCSRCEADLPFLVGPLCPRCGQPQISGILCASCAVHPSSIEAIRSVFRFEGTARRAVHELKYHNLRAIAPTLASYIATCMTEAGMTADVMVPVPLHPSHERLRGYNQAAILAREVGKLHNMRVLPRSLRRAGTSTSQVRTKNVEERRRNVRGAFRWADSPLLGSTVMLIDDVCTTGATLDACASAIREAGATRVVALTVAREV